MTDAYLQTERWFRSRGLALLVRGTPAETTTATRATPALVSWFVVAMLVGVPMMTSVGFMQTMIIAVAALLVTWVGANLLRRRRPLAPVARIGVPEGIAFVLVPMLSVGLATDPAIGEMFELDGRMLILFFAFLTGTVQATVLATILLLERWGLVTLAGWLARSLFGTFAETGSALATTLPVSLGVVFFFFLNPGVWGTVGIMTGPGYAALVLLLLTLAGLFLGSQRQFGLDDLTTFATASDYRAALAETPLPDAPSPDAWPAVTPLSSRQLRNVRLVAILSQLVVALVVALATFLLLLVIGYLAVPSATVDAWTRAPQRPLLSIDWLGATYVITAGHLKVAGFLATFSAFNFSLVSATDARLRQGTKETVAEMVRQASALRLALLTTSVPPPDAPLPSNPDAAGSA